MSRRSVEYMVELTQRRRGAEHTGGYAVFHKLTDVLDLDAAYAVVQELGPEHRFSVRLTEYETECRSPPPHLGAHSGRGGSPDRLLAPVSAGRSRSRAEGPAPQRRRDFGRRCGR